MAGMDTYKDLLKVPRAISEEMAQLDKNRKRVQADFDNEQENITEDFENAEAASKEVEDRLKAEADARYNSWGDKLNQYRVAAEKTHGRAVSALKQALGAMENITTQQALQRLDEETAQRKKRHKKDDNMSIVKYGREEVALAGQIEELGSALLGEASSQRDREVNVAVTRFQADHKEHAAERDARLTDSRRRQRIRNEYEEETFVERVEHLIRPDKVHEQYEELRLLQPNHEVFEPAEKFPEGVQFGFAGYDVTAIEKDPLKAAVLKKRFGFAMREANGRDYLAVPYGYAFTDKRFSTMFEFSAQNRAEAQEDLKNLAMNLYMSIPVNKCWCTFIDPVSLGGTFALFAPLGERDESGRGDERAIDTRIWSSEKDIEERLELIIGHTTDVIQRCLQGQYKNIIDYNEAAGVNAEPMRFLVVMDFPKHFTDRSLDMLESILDNGPQTGVYTLIAGDQEEMNNWPESSAVGRIRGKISNTVKADGNFLYVQEGTLEGKMRYFPVTGPTTEQAGRIIRGIRERLGESIEITYPMVSGNLPGRPEYWFNKSAIDGISVPIGMEGAGKMVNLEFGEIYQSFSAMIGGTTGAGKTTLLHTIIHSVLFNYSPDDVQIWLLDFKQGVEVSCYAENKLPNFRVICVETEPEFGLAVLMELHQEILRRSAKFKNVGVGRIEHYWKYKGERGESHADMPRILVIFDEIQALLDDEGSELNKNCASLIRELVTQGRAFGIHLILSTQTYANVKGLDNGVYSNIHTRIALKGDKESTEILLDNDNEIANRLISVDPGQGVFNNNAGSKDSNRTFRVAVISPEQRDIWMKQVHERQLEVMSEEPPKPRILLSGPEDDSENPLSVFAATGARPFVMGDPTYHLYIGESLTMTNTYFPALSAGRGQNLLLAGRDQENSGLSRMIMGYSVLSLLYETIRLQGEITAPFITVFDLSGMSIYGSGDLDMLDYIENMVPEAFRIVPVNQLLNGIETLYQELYSGRQQFVLFYGLNRAKQLTTGTYERSPKEVLEQLFAEGPANGMNFIVWANDPELFVENYQQDMQYFDNRLAFGMEDKEYKAITGENGPKYASPSNAVTYNPIGDNEKIRMYKRPTEEWLREFLNNVRKYVR